MKNIVVIEFLICIKFFVYDDVQPEIFDSYYESTNLENIPDFCTEYSNENCAKAWLSEVNVILSRNDNRMINVLYKYETNINKENQDLLKKFRLNSVKLIKELQLKAGKFQWKNFHSSEIRKIFKKLTDTTESKNETISQELIDVQSKIEFIYNNGKPCFGKCLNVGEPGIIDLFLREKDYDQLTGYWLAWRNVTGAKIRNLFIEKVKLENLGARENNFSDTASFILLNDFEEENFKDTVLKLYEDILPLYKELHSYVRYCLGKYYPGRFDKNGAIPAHIFGNVWAQQWTNLFSMIKKCGNFGSQHNFQEEVNMKLSKFSVNEMFKMAEEFYDSIGLYKMTNEFWERSVLKQLPEKVIDCHGSAYDFSNTVDFRILMCTKKNLIDFTTIHHEMGHIEYFMSYRNLPIYYRGSANSGFHEAIGDTIALSVKTPEHLHKIGLLSNIPEGNNFDIEYLMSTALEKVAFLPFALMMDSYIWGIYNGSVSESELNKHWWNLAYRYQGIKPPIERSENDFDAGGKYHIAFGVPYIRYFVSFIVQFQFYESMCNLSGYKGALHRCDFYESKEAGIKMKKMLKQGQSKPWRETMKILTGTRMIKAEPLLKFFEPLYLWLKNENEKLNNYVGW